MFARVRWVLSRGTPRSEVRRYGELVGWRLGKWVKYLWEFLEPALWLMLALLTMALWLALILDWVER